MVNVVDCWRIDIGLHPNCGAIPKWSSIFLILSNFQRPAFIGPRQFLSFSFISTKEMRKKSGQKISFVICSFQRNKKTKNPVYNKLFKASSILRRTALMLVVQ